MQDMSSKRRSRPHLDLQGAGKKRAEADGDVAKLDPKKLPAAVKQGLAPAMNANPRHPYWGKQEEDETTTWLFGDSTPEERSIRSSPRNRSKKSSLGSCAAAQPKDSFAEPWGIKQRIWKTTSQQER